MMYIYFLSLAASICINTVWWIIICSEWLWGVEFVWDNERLGLVFRINRQVPVLVKINQLYCHKGCLSQSQLSLVMDVTKKASLQKSRATHFGQLCWPWSKVFFSGTVHIILPNHLVCTWACWEGTLFRSHQKSVSVNECRVWMNLGIFISIHSTSLPAGGPLSLLHQSRARGRNDGHRCGRWIFWWFELPGCAR